MKKYIIIMIFFFFFGTLTAYIIYLVEMANVESVEQIMNMVMNKPDEDTLEEVPQSPQQSPPSVQWNTPPHIQVAAMLVKVKEIESKLSSLTLNKLDLMTFLEELTTDLSLLKHKLQLPYKGHKFAITTPPVNQVMKKTSLI